MNDERELKELLHRADVECEQRMTARGHTAPKTNARPRHNDRLQTHVQQLVTRSFAEAMKRPTGTSKPSTAGTATPTGRTRRLADIDDDTLIRGITEPAMLDLR